MRGGEKEQEHVRDAAALIQEMRRQRREDLPPLKRLVERVVARFATPFAALAVVVFIGIWVGLQFTLPAHGIPFDSNTFALLGLIAQLLSLVLVVGVLVADGTQAEIDQERSRLILQMLIIQDRKISEALKGFEQLARAQGLQPREEIQRIDDSTDLHEAAAALRKAREEQGQDT